MALHNTSDRYHYIYGNTVRTMEEIPQEPVRRGQPQKREYEKKGQTAGKQPASKTRSQKQHAVENDWKYTVVASVAILICVISGIFYVGGTVQLHSMSSQVSELKEEKAKLLNKQAALQSEIDKSINLDDISSYAEDKLGMVYPDREHVISYTDSTNDYFRQYESVNVNQ